MSTSELVSRLRRSGDVRSPLVRGKQSHHCPAVKVEDIVNKAAVDVKFPLGSRGGTMVPAHKKAGWKLRLYKRQGCSLERPLGKAVACWIPGLPPFFSFGAFLTAVLIWASTSFGQGWSTLPSKAGVARSLSLTCGGPYSGQDLCKQSVVGSSFPEGVSGQRLVFWFKW